MLTNILKAIFGSKSARDVKRMTPLVNRINKLEEEYQKLTDDQLKAKSQTANPLTTFSAKPSRPSRTPAAASAEPPRSSATMSSPGT